MNSKNILSSVVFVLVLTLFGVSATFAAQNVIDVQFTEKAYEHVVYNPQQSASGLYVDNNENRSLYAINGTIVIVNNHNTEAVHDVFLNITGVNNTYGMAFDSGSQAFISEMNIASDYMIVLIPDLGPGANSTFVYQVNETLVAPPLNFTTSYSDNRIFAGLPITVTDTISNDLNATLYPVNCLYDINITQYAMDYNQSGTILNFTFGAPLAGTDAGNAGIVAGNRQLDWDAQAGACLNSGASTDINYELNTPAGINLAQDYQVINSTIKYKFNETISRLKISKINAVLDLDLEFDKYLDTVLTGDNATWRVNGTVINPTNITVNLTQVSFWVSVRDGTGTGFTNPSIVDNDTMDGSSLVITHNPNILMNNTLPDWNTAGNEWFFNYTYSSSPIVWMDITNMIVIDDGVQLTNRSISYGEDSVYVKELYLATGYWLQISRNITRLSEGNYTVLITVRNLGTSPTPASQVVQVYNFIPIEFTLTSPFVTSDPAWYDTVNASEVLNDPIYNGTMHQFGILATGNPSNSSLAAFGGSFNENNTWTLEYNVSGSGEFNFDDLFLTGVDPLNVKEFGATQAVTVEGVYGYVESKLEAILGLAALVVGALVLLL